jgi:SAM-dependent methyltransferase
MDRFPPFLNQLNHQARRVHPAPQIQPLTADMHHPPFADQSFDLIWSEGAIYIMGYDHGLNCWRPLLRPGGYLVVTELSWFKPNPPDELLTYWQVNYPAMRSVAENLHAAERQGWKPIGDFPLPLAAWTEDYYGPLQRRFPGFLAGHANDPDAQAVVAMTEQEIAVMTRYADHCGYQFYVLQRL